MKNYNGFTLLEVLVALAILAIAMFAIIKVTAENIENASYLRNKTLAHWVAMNVLVEIQIQEKWPDIGTKKGVYKMATHDWHWLLKISKTFDHELRRLEITISLQEEPLTNLVGFVHYN